MVDTETNIQFAQDEQAVQAVRGGDAERYRELVERHERRVFAVAWSRLGDAALAEEVAQEAFIHGYRRLWLLGDGAKFSGWIAAITRRMAINCGMRNRRELNKRQRWAVEQTAAPAEEPTELCPPETLREALAGLPAGHRECLVLFYLEGKSGAEAAAALGISETALRVRLHRARAALRERLEEKLEGSLAKLRPAKTLVPVVMAGVLASSSAKAAGGTVAMGVGAKILSVVGKTFLFSWFLPLLSLVSALPSLAFVSFLGRMERKNLRDADGFRPELHRRFFRSFLWGFPLLLVAFAIINQSAMAAWGLKMQQFAVVCFLLFITLISARSLTICRNHFHIGCFAYCVIIEVGLCALALGWLPPSLSMLPTLAGAMLFFFIIKKRPARLDYNLFLRASHGMLKVSDAADGPSQANRLDRRVLLAFARFLGARFLVSNFRWETSGLALRLPPVANQFLTNIASVFLPPISQNCTHILLGWDGMASAHCGETDARNLPALKTARTTDAQELESVVAESVRQAWQEFRAGNLAGAERMLGDSPESELFIVPPARAKSMRWMRIWLGASVLLMLAAMIMQFLRPANSTEMFKPVSVTTQEVRTTLAALAASGPIGSNAIFQANSGLYACHLLPRKAEDFTPEAWQVMRDHLLGEIPTGVVRPNDKVDRLMGWRALQTAIINGWLTADDFGLTTEEIRRALAPATDWQRTFWFEPTVQSMNADRTTAGYTVLDAEGFARRMQCLQRLDCLGVVDGRNAVATLLQHQMHSTSTPPGRRKIPFPEQWHGLFLTYGQNPITETYDALVALELLGGLGRIDREACAQGILRFHHGKGLFRAIKDNNEVVLFGDARETFCAFESLRILGALDRVKDLARWQFRPLGPSSKKAPGEVRSVTWFEMDAWLCQQRLAQDLAEHKQNPAAPWRSLLEH